MQIGIRKRFVFVANTKAASTSIEFALAPHAEIQRSGTPKRKHVWMRDALRIYDFVFSQEKFSPGTFFRFAVMREPSDWIASWYRYRCGNGKIEAKLPAEITFDEFWRKNDWNITRADGRPNLQRDLFCRPDGEMLIDYIIPYETLDTEFARICEGLGVKAALPKLNRSAITASEREIPRELRDEVRAHLQPDYEIYERLESFNEAGWARLEQTRRWAEDGPV
ncbi:sulfotransferase family 2 domain-containing protein [Tropicimonas marinistellae]|uniref:sulfotransferase family 2 domain-containing protein n=1 Tax=Tropicimonas marinistellae TaxID=1739787 RepID=UPI00082B7468|nr:sulfotransferase family 2 domain-containing protein [Tropicimonas marinistellae]